MAGRALSDAVADATSAEGVAPAAGAPALAVVPVAFLVVPALGATEVVPPASTAADVVVSPFTEFSRAEWAS